MISEHIEKIVPIQPTPNPTDGDRSKQVKALLKNRILNKSLITNTQAQQKPTTSKAAPKMPPPVCHETAPRSGGISPAPAASSMSIAKADLTVRQKQPPLLLNLVNQLPKHRAMCVSSDSPLVNPHGTVHQVSPSPQRIPVQQTTNVFSQPHPPPEVPIARAAPTVPTQLHRSPTPPLIVLEHKVLAPNEKIDLSGLRLPNTPVEATNSPDSAATPNIQSKVIKGKIIMNANKFKVSREKLAEMAKEIRNQADQVKQPQAIKTLNSKDVISTMDTHFTINTILQPKRTSPFSSPTLKGNIAPLYNPKPNKATDFSAGSSIRSNPLPVESTKQTIIESNESTEDKAIDFPTSVPTTPGNRYSSEPNQATSNSVELELVSNLETEGVMAVANPIDFPVYIPSTPDPTTESSPLKSFNEPINYPEVNALGSSTPVYIPITSERGHLTAEVTTESNLVDLPEPENIPKDMNADLVQSVPLISKLNREPNTEIGDMHSQADTSAVSQEQSSSSAATSPEHKIQSAVDFIAQLTAENPLDESSFMDLSPEEQRLSALFGFGGCSFASSSVTQPEEEELPIGKIVKMDDMNILHATLDISSDSTNVLRISPNAVKMQSSVTSLSTPLVDLQVGDSALEDTNIHNNFPNPVDNTTASELQNVKSSVTETSIQEANDETTVITTLPKKCDEKSQVPLEEVKTASDPEPLKEVNPPVKRAPIRSKKAKINLVQRTKRPSIQKPIEVKKAKLDFEEEDEQAMAIDHSLMEDRYGVPGIEVNDNSASTSSDQINHNLSSVKNNPKVPADEKKCEEEISPVQDEDSAKSQAHEDKDDESEISYQKEDKIQSKSSSERDLTQLYHPPKMPKNKSTHKTSSQEDFEVPQPASSSSNVSLIDVLSQNPPAPQGEPQLPFRKDSQELNTSVDSSVDAKGIQNLIGHLTAEKVVPQTKKLSPTSKTEEASKALPRKKLVKTRPVLSKRSTKVGQKNPSEKPVHFEFLHPVSANAGNRIPTSSTSDDDGSIFLGFDDNEGKRSKTPVRSQRVKQMKINETDISDDATPDYDETEEEQPSIEIQQPVKNSAADSKFTFDRHQVVGAFSDDSDSSDAGPSSPMDFGDNMSIEDSRTSEEDVTAWAKLVNENEKPFVDEVLSPSKSGTEATVDCSRIDDPLKTDGEATSSHHSEITPFCASSESKCVTDEKQPVIKEKDSITLDRKSEKSRRMSTKSILMTTDEHVKDSSTTSKINEKRLTSSPLKTPGSSENTELRLLEEGNASDKQNEHLISPEALTNQKNAKLKKNLEEVSPEKPVSSLRSRGKRKSGSHNKKLDESEKHSENISCAKKEEKATERDLEDGEQLTTVDSTEDTDSTRNPIDNITAENTAIRAKRKTRCIVSKDSKKEMNDLKAPEDGVKSSKDDLPPTMDSSEKPEDQKLDDVPDVSVKSKGTRKSLRASLNNEVPAIQPEPVINTVSSSENSTSKMKEVVTEPNDAKNKRHTRNKSPQIKGSPTIKHFESIESEAIKGSDALSKAESSIRPTRQRQSRYSKAKSEPKAPADSKSENVSDPSISTVTQDLGQAKYDSSEKSSGDVQLNPVKDSCNEQEACKDSNQAKDLPKSRKKRQSQNGTSKIIVPPVTQPKPEKLHAQNRDESVRAPKEQLDPTTSKNSRGKRQSRSIAATNTPTTMLTTASEDPEAVEEDSVVVPIKRKASTRRGSVPRDTPISSVNASDESEVLESVPKKGRRSNISSVPADTTIPKSSKSDSLNAIEMIPPICEEPKVPSKRGRKRAAPSDIEPGLDKKLKTEESSETERVVDFNLRLLLIRKRDQLDTDEVLTNDGKGQGPLQCGLCLVRSDKNNWQRHIGEHYGVGWLVGETPKVG